MDTGVWASPVHLLCTLKWFGSNLWAVASWHPWSEDVNMTVSAESEAGEAGLPQLPHKSRSLRQSSVAKRLAVESGAGAGARETKAKIRGVKRLSRYRRKTENAKERERMKKFNQAFENLRQKLPNRELLSEKSISGEKDTKVSL